MPTEKSNIRSSHWADMETGMQYQHRPQTIKNFMNAKGNESFMNPKAAPFEPSASDADSSTGQDKWRQQKRVQIPVFAEDKRNY